MRRIAPALLPLVLLTAISCRGPFLVPTVDTASLVLSFAGAGASTARTAGGRTILPAADLGIDSIHVEVTGPGGTIGWDGGVGDPCEITEITPGDITVTASARNGGTVVAEGEVSFTLAPGATVSRTIDLEPASEGTGSLSFTMEWPESTGAAFVECSLSGGTPHAQSQTVAPSGGVYTWTYEVTDLDSGDYDVFITFRPSEASPVILGSFVECANVYGGLASDTWLDGEGNQQDRRVFTARELLDSLTELAALTITGGDTPLVYTPPALVPGCAIDAGRTSRGTVGFTATLANPGCGQTIDYAWNATPGTVDSGLPSDPLPLNAMGLGNTLQITVTASSGESALYTVTLTRAYRLSYSANGATSGSPPPDQLGLPAEVLTVAGPGTLERTDYTFAGWNTQPAGTGTSYQPDAPLILEGDTVLYARWLRNGTVGVSFSLPEYRTVVFRYNGAEVTTLFVASSEEPLEILYTDTGSLVSGWQWYVDGAPVGTGTGTYELDIHDNGRYVVSCTTVYNGVRYAGSLAVTVNDPLTVSYDGNYADSGSVPAGGTYAEGAIVAVAGNTGGLARSGYTWVGWSPDPAATVPTYTGTGCEVFAMGPASVTLYAVWGLDTTPPSAVTEFGATTGVGSVTVFWTDPTDTDLAGVCVEYYGATAGFVMVAKGGQTVEMAAPDLVDGTPYTFFVFAYDEAGNYSEGAVYWACPGGAVESDFVCPSGVIDEYRGAGGDVVIPGSVGGVPVTAIGEGVFGGCTGLATVTIPDSVTSIGAVAFLGCTGLTSVTMPGSLISIGDEAFHGCTGLTSVTMPDSLISIGARAFWGCTGLTTVTIPDSVTSIDHGAFADCAGLTTVTIPDSVTGIGDSAFGGCTGLTTVTIPDSVTSIGGYAFDSCSGLDSVTIPDSVTSIGTYAFYGCTGLTTVTIPDSVTSIGDSAFAYCTGLTSVTIPDSVTSIGTDTFRGCSGLTTVTIPDSVTSIGYRAFQTCSGLTTVTIPDSVTSIGQDAFRGSGLTTVTIPDSVTSIGGYAFRDCPGLTAVEIGNGVTFINSYAFYNCGILAVVYVNATTPPTLGTSAFNGNAVGRIIYVPASVDDSIVNAYRAATNWSAYAASIQERP